jgi:hypothetical protein
MSEKTVDSYADTVRLHITPSLGRKVLRRLTVSDVDQLLARKRSAGYSANTVRIIRAVLRRALRQAERKAWFRAMRPPSRLHRAFAATKVERSRLTKQKLFLIK